MNTKVINSINENNMDIENFINEIRKKEYKEIIEYDKIIDNLKKYKKPAYNGGTIEIKSLGVDLEKKLNINRYNFSNESTWKLRAGFVSNPLENTINLIQGFCFYFDGDLKRSKEPEKYIASLKQTADPAFYQLAFALESSDGRITPPIGIGILIECQGNEIDITKLKDYFLFEGFTGSTWLKNITLMKSDIQTFITEEIIKFIDSYREHNKEIGLLVDTSKPRSKKQKIMDELIKNKLIEKHSTKKSKVFKVRDGKDNEYDFTHFLTRTYSNLNNIHHTHSYHNWQGYVNYEGKIPPEYIINEETHGIVTTDFKYYKKLSLGGGWTNTSGLVSCIELNKEDPNGLKINSFSMVFTKLGKFKVKDNATTKKKVSPLLVLPIIAIPTGGIIINKHMTEEVKGKIINKNDLEDIDTKYIIYKHNKDQDRTAREIGKYRKRGYGEGGFGDSFVPKEDLSDISYKMPSLEYMLDPEIEVKGEIPLIGKPRLIVEGIEFKLNDEDDLRNLINVIITKRYENFVMDLQLKIMDSKPDIISPMDTGRPLK